MFDLFTDAARTALVEGQAEAIDRADARMGTEHLLLGLLRGGTGRAVAVLDAHGLTLDAARSAVDDLVGPPPSSADASGALATIGIDLDKVQDQLTGTFGEAASAPVPVPYDDTAKAAIEAAVAAAGDAPTTVDTGHELLGILAVTDGVAATAITQLGIDRASLAHALRADVTTET